MVTATGELITVSSTENPNLFWGIRGGGSNFGIITSATYRIFDTVNNGQIVNADFLLPASANRTVFELLSSFEQETLPAELALTAQIRFNGTVNEVSSPHTHRRTPQLLVFTSSWTDLVTFQTQIVFNALYFGPMERAMPYLSTLMEAPWIRRNISMVPWNRIFTSNAFGNGAAQCSTNRYISLYTAALRRNNVATFQSVFAQMAQFFLDVPGYRGFLTLNRFPQQAVLAVPDAETAYPWRETKTQAYVTHFNPHPQSFLLPSSTLSY